MTEEVSSNDRSDGFAPIKKEFLNLNHKPRLAVDYLPKKAAEELRHLIEDQTGDEPAAKKPKLTGRNKKRPFEKRGSPSERLCPSIANERVCSYGVKCKFSHDVAKFFNRDSSGGTTRCYLFETFGRCPYGLSCLYAGQHTDDSMKSIINQELVDKFCGQTFVRNSISKDMQIRLRKREYDFSRSNIALKKVEQEVKSSKSKRKDVKTAIPWTKSSRGILSGIASGTSILSKDESVAAKEELCKTDQCSSLDIENGKDLCTVETVAITNISAVDTLSENLVSDLSQEKVRLEPTSVASKQSPNDSVNQSVVSEISQTSKASGCVTDEDLIKLRKEEKKSIDFRGKLYLAPLTTVGNLPFRRICKRLGADITCGEMAMSANLLQGQQSEWALIKRHETETLFGMQLCGSFADTMTRTTQVLSENMQVDFIDINIGCPIDLVVQRGEGCALMGRSARFEQIVKSVSSVIDVPLTVKMRTGLQEGHNIAHTLLPSLAQWNVAMTTIHGRTREQRYTKLADWQYIKLCVEAAKPMPIFGNGDIMSYMDYKRCLESTGVDGCMIARGALIKPWVFTEIKEQRDWDISATERFEIVKDFANYGLEHWGSDKQGVANTRRFLLEWLSFSHRYIPVGLLERVPQRINERPPYYFGRSDLETLLASPNCADWIKISEMLLGPVPDDFAFLPKHRANSYQ